MEEIKEYIDVHKKLHAEMVEKIRDRKAKIRKFMVFVNNALNQTENEMADLWDVFIKLEHCLGQYAAACEAGYEVMTEDNDGKTVDTGTEAAFQVPQSCKRRKLQSNTPLPQTLDSNLPIESLPHTTSTQKPASCDISQALTVGSQLSAAKEGTLLPIISDRNLDIPPDSLHTSPVVDTQKNHCNAETSNNMQTSSVPQADVLGSFDETVGVLPVTQVESSIVNERAKSKFEVSRLESALEESSNNGMAESQNYILTPVSHLLSDVLSNVSGGSSSKSSASTDVFLKPNDVKKSMPKKTSSLKSTKGGKEGVVDGLHAPAVFRATSNRLAETENNLLKSPSLFSDDEKKDAGVVIAADTEDEEPQVEQVESSSDVIVTKVKRKPVWPIKYPKPSTTGVLVIEPVSDSRPRRRTRQTKLDGYLSKAASFNQSNSDKQISLLALNAKDHNAPDHLAKPSTTAKHAAVVSSDSDDELGMNPSLLKPKSAGDKPAGSKTSVSITTVQPVKSESDSTTDPTNRVVISEPQDVQNSSCSPSEKALEKRAKYEVGQVVRGKARKELTGYRCKACYQYYKTLDLTDEEIQSRVDEVCKHRAVKPPMETPPHFWNMSLISSLNNSPP